MAAPTINGFESIVPSVNAADDPKTISLTTQTYTAGDYVLFVFGENREGAVVGVTGATDDTYAAIAQYNDGVEIGLSLFEGTVNGGALDASISVDVAVGRHAVHGVITISGAAANASQPNAVSTESTGDSNDASAAEVITTVDECLVFAIISCLGSHVLATLNAATPSGWTLLGSWRNGADQPANSVFNTVAIAYKTMATAGATGVATWTDGMGSTQPWVGYQIAIAPGVGGLGKFILTRPA